MTDTAAVLPYICPEHPRAQVRHTWDRTQFVYGDGYPRGSGIDSNHQYECAICRRALAPPKKGDLT